MNHLAVRPCAALALALFLAGAVSACIDSGGVARPAVPAAGVTAGATAPGFMARDIDGRDVRLDDYLGSNVVLLDFCSTWCEPCVAEFPHLRKLYAENKDKGFVVLAIAVDGAETAANVPGFTRRNRLTFPMVVDEDGQISALYNPKKTAPLTVLIDRSGKIVFIHEGYSAGDENTLGLEVARAVGTGWTRKSSSSGDLRTATPGFETKRAGN